MDKLTKKRKPIRSAFTKTYNELMGESEIEKVRLLFTKLNRLIAELKDLDEKILEFLLDDSNDKLYDDEYNGIEEYREKFDQARQKAEAVFVERPPSEDFAIRTTKLKLPKIELRKFTGEVSEWLGFWSQFRRIHEDLDVEKEDKFQYLIQATAERSRARDVVASFPPTADNYEKAIQCLQSRFGKDELLIEFYVRELLSLVIQNVSSKSKLTPLQLYDKLELHLRSLESLGMTGDKYAALLFPLVESSLPEDLLRIWLRSSVKISSKDAVNSDTNNEHCDKLNQLLLFLKNEVEGEQRITLAQGEFQMSQPRPMKPKMKREDINNIPTASNLFSGDLREQKKQCLFCKCSHEAKECFKAQKMTLAERKTILLKGGYCYQCLRHGHTARMCKNEVRCHVCGKKHVVLMCPDLPSNVSASATKEDKIQEMNDSKPSTTLNNQNYNDEILLQTLLVKIRGDKSERTVRALIDSGSQRSYILKKTVENIGLKPTGSESMIHALFGGVHSKKRIHQIYHIKIRGLEDKEVYEISALDQNVICGTLPKLRKGPWLKELKKSNISLSDYGKDRLEIELLLGADVCGKLLTGRIKNLKSGPVAIETHLGWVVMGRIATNEKNEEASNMLTTLLLTLNSTITDLWRLDTLGIRDPVEKKSQEEAELSALTHFKTTVSVDIDGRYEVHLPWNERVEDLRENFSTAKKRCITTTLRLIREGQFDDYGNVFKDWLLAGVIEEVPSNEIENKSSYLPHRGIFKINSTTPVRPVFDASCRESDSPSVNDCLEKGPNLLEQIPPILTRFRRRRFGVISDIKKAFLQISIASKDRDFLRFLWWEDFPKKQIKIFRHRRVVFGLTCSPFLLGAVLDLHLEKGLAQYQETVKLLKQSFYVDNCVTSFNNEAEVKRFIDESTKLLNEAHFELRGWEYNSMKKENDIIRDSAVLGLLWDRREDVLYCDVKPFTEVTPITRRRILSSAHRIFDPIGFTCPFTLLPKILLQFSWNLKVSWDDPLPDDLQQKFKKWENEVSRLSKVKISRCISADDSEATWSLHVFCDASQAAYAAVVYLRSGTKDVILQLIQAKARVTPLKNISVPRLELLACCIGCRLAASVRNSLSLDIPEFYWTDSSTALFWIKGEETWGPFVNNRVKEIKLLTKKECWRHIPGDLNPADLPSRGCSLENLIKSRWWEGPTWLRNKEEDWPKSEVMLNYDEIWQEKRKTSPTLLCSTQEEPTWYLRRFSRFSQVIRLVAWMLRFKWNSLRRGERQRNDLSVWELNHAERRILSFVQTETSEQIENLKTLSTFVDEDGLMRIKTKITRREDNYTFRYPIILPSNHPIVEALITEHHLQNSHAGVQTLLAILREKYWILRGRKTVRRVVHKCIRCRRYESKKKSVDPAPLPEDRVKDASTFEISGVDMAGPLYLRNGEKAWILLFTCAVYRAVHLELVLSISTESFLQGFRRFVARRGRPKVIYSDNGTNFTGTENMFKLLDWEKINRDTSIFRIQWKFIPPTAAWWGGWWERIIQMVKKLLRRALGKASLTYQEMATILCDVEAVINSRPLTYLSEDPNDLIPLSPAMFLQDVREVGVPDLDQLDKTNLKKRARYLQRLREELRRRFRDEYLGLLVQRQLEKGCQQPVKVGDVVLLGSDTKKRIEWPIAKIQELYPGADGLIRVVQVKTSGGEFIRPIQRLYPLEVSSNEASLPKKEMQSHPVEGRFDVPEAEGPDSDLPIEGPSVARDIKTRRGRVVKLPSRYQD